MKITCLKAVNFNILTLLILLSCSGMEYETKKAFKKLNPLTAESNTQRYEDDSVSNYLPLWYDAAKRFRSYDRKGNLDRHLFFDPAPASKKENRSINFIVITPFDSPTSYRLDSQSGQRYRHHTYCEQDDIWGRYEGTVKRPNYTRGIVPRVVDSTGGPQNIIVFGNESFYKGYSHSNSQRVRVVGGIILQDCPKGKCNSSGEWLTKLILVGVDTRDKEYASIENLHALKEKIDWPYTKAFLENGEGRNLIVKTENPGYRIAGEVDAREAFNFSIFRSKNFNKEKAYELRKSCHKLYDHIWKNIGDSSVEAQRKYDFKTRFLFVYKKFAKEFDSCSDFVKVSNVNDNAKRHWFFVYYTLVMKMLNAGYYYNCTSNTWAHNPRGYGDSYFYDPYEELKMCKGIEIDHAFKRVVPYLKTLKAAKSKYFRYFAYDNHPRGTHGRRLT